jgi:hypothetical protein
MEKARYLVLRLGSQLERNIGRTSAGILKDQVRRVVCCPNDLCSSFFCFDKLLDDFTHAFFPCWGWANPSAYDD